MIESNDRDLQLKTYSELIQPVSRKKPIDIDMEVEPLFKNLYIHPHSSQYSGKNLYYDRRTDELCFEYDYDFEKLRSLGCSRRIRFMFENLGIPEKKSFRYITRLMNRHENISRVNRIYYFTEW